MIDDDSLPGKVAQLLSEPHPRVLAQGQRPDREFSVSPLGRAQAMLCLAGDLVTEADYGAAVPDWEERHARLRVLRDELSAGVVVGARRDALRAEVENLCMRGRARWKQTERLHLGSWPHVARRAAAILLHCKERQAEIATAGLGRADEIGYLMAMRIGSTPRRGVC